MSKKRIFWFIALLALAMGCMFLLGHRTSSKTTLLEYKAALRARGEKLTPKELLAGYKESTNQSLALITNIGSRLPSGTVHPSLLELMKFDAPGSAKACSLADSPPFSSGRNVSWQELGTALKQTQDDLEKLRSALKDPAADMGALTNFLDRPRPFIALRATAQWLSGSAVYALHEHQNEQALRDVEALGALTQVDRDDPTLVSQMIRVAIAGLGLAVTWEALQHPDWTDADLERMQRAWIKADLIEALEKGFVGERCFGENAFEMIRNGQISTVHSMFLAPLNGTGKSRGRIDQYALLELYRLSSANDDELLYLQTMQGSIELVRRLRSNAWIEVTANWNTNYSRLNAVSGSLQRYRYWFSMMAIPNYQRALQTAVQKETLRQLTITAIALKRYALRHGQPAPNLEALVPEFLDRLPRDPFGNSALRYRNTGAGMTLYSVGEDGKDDQGNPQPSSTGASPDLWNGKDVIWPSLSSTTNR